MAGLVIEDGIKESDYGYVLRVSGPRELKELYLSARCQQQAGGKRDPERAPPAALTDGRLVRWPKYAARE